jgi:glycosyltransferase involved in cell wall biosynthesis
MKLKVAVNTRLLIPDKLEGIGRFSHEILKRLTVENPDIEFHFIFDRQGDSQFRYGSNVIFHRCFPPTRHSLLMIWYFEFSLPSLLKKIGADVYFSPDGWLSLHSKVPTLQVVHDINFFHQPENLPLQWRLYYNYFFPKFCHRADKILTVSEFSANDIALAYGINRTKIGVLVNSTSGIFFPGSERSNQEIRERYTNGKPYFLFVGLLHKRKNPEGILRAFDQFSNLFSDYYLIMAGDRKWWTEELDIIYKRMNFRNQVIFTGRIDEKTLSKLYQGAFALLYPSYFEGFGIPILEAFESGIPVITSETSSMPEVGGDACLYVNPNSPGSIAEKMLLLHNNPNLRNTLIAQGHKRSKEYSWGRSVTVVRDSIYELLK